MLFFMNCSGILQQIYKNCSNEGQERFTQSALADIVTYLTDQNSSRSKYWCLL